MSMIFNDLKKSDDDFCFGGYMNALPVQKKNTDIEELKAYRAIGTVSEFRELKEKATPKKPYYVYLDEPLCPHCHMILDGFEEYCEECRQKIDWSEGKEG